MTISRRDLLKAAAAAAALPLPFPGPSPQAPGPRFFTPAEFALLDELTELIIPADEQSGGARAAGVASYIDRRVKEGEADVQARWRSGLNAVNALSREMHRKAFLAGTPEQRVAVLTRMSAAEDAPKTPVEKFFKDLKWWTVFGYYTSKVGIHDDQQYKGNVVQTGDYAGYDPT